MVIIALGITALISILTFFDALTGELKASFSKMGSNTFSISNRVTSVQRGPHRRQKTFKPITYQQAVAFKKRFDYPSITSITINATRMGKVRYKDNETDPNVTVIGIDENYFVTAGFDLGAGRNFSKVESDNGAHVTIIGQDIVAKLFGTRIDPLGKHIHIGDARFLVVGVLESKGNTFGMNMDNQCFITIPSARQYFSQPKASYTINVKARKPEELDPAMSEATGVFRTIRRIEPGRDNTFEAAKSDMVANLVVEQTSTISFVASMVGSIALICSILGLMNSMLVSVTERTREIGIRKALGASSGTIRQQFLIESIMLSVIGGVFGVIFGITIGNIIAAYVEFPFVMPWGWSTLAVGLCLGVGILSGYYPAKKAAALDPIESLRYE